MKMPPRANSMWSERSTVSYKTMLASINRFDSHRSPKLPPLPLRSIPNQVSHTSDTTHTRKKKQKVTEKNDEAESSKRSHPYVSENESLLVVPFDKRSLAPVIHLTNRLTITREENYANPRWSEVPTSLQFPDPPSNWRKKNPRRIRLEDEVDDVSARGRLSSISSNDKSSTAFVFSTQKSGYDSGYDDQVLLISLNDTGKL